MLVHRQTRLDFSIIFLIVLLTLFCLTTKRVQKIEAQVVRAEIFLSDQ
jgi:hypothetical protein